MLVERLDGFEHRRVTRGKRRQRFDTAADLRTGVAPAFAEMGCWCPAPATTRRTSSLSWSGLPHEGKEHTSATLETATTAPPNVFGPWQDALALLGRPVASTRALALHPLDFGDALKVTRIDVSETHRAHRLPSRRRSGATLCTPPPGSIATKSRRSARAKVHPFFSSADWNPLPF